MLLADLLQDCSDSELSSSANSASVQPSPDSDPAPAAQGHVANAELLNKLKKQAQTANARAQVRVNRAKRKRQEEESDASSADPLQESYAARIVDNCLTKRLFLPSGGQDTRAARERARAVKSLLSGIVQALLRLVGPRLSSPAHAVLSTAVFDETNARLKPPSREKSVVYTMLNTVATVHVMYSITDSADFFLPTPLLVLPSPKTEDLHAALCAALPLTSAGAGRILHAAGLPADWGRESKWRCMVLVGDALRTNDAVVKLERQLQAAGAQQQGKAPRLLLVRLKCTLHQIALIRKPVVLSVRQYWSTLVRFGHLMESQAFRRQICLATVQLAQSSTGFRRFSANKTASFEMFTKKRTQTIVRRGVLFVWEPGS